MPKLFSSTKTCCQSSFTTVVSCSQARPLGCPILPLHFTMELNTRVQGSDQPLPTRDATQPSFYTPSIAKVRGQSHGCVDEGGASQGMQVTSGSWEAPGNRIFHTTSRKTTAFRALVSDQGHSLPMSDLRGYEAMLCSSFQIKLKSNMPLSRCAP